MEEDNLRMFRKGQKKLYRRAKFLVRVGRSATCGTFKGNTSDDAEAIRVELKLAEEYAINAIKAFKSSQSTPSEQ
jgi:hypothetical protein